MKEQYSPGRSLLRSFRSKGPRNHTDQTALEARSTSPAEYIRARWSIHDSPISDYDRTFSRVLGKISLSEELKKRAKARSNPTILDLMATEAVVGEAAQYGYSGVAVSLGFRHESVWDEMYGEGRVRIVNGDITTVELWNKVEHEKHDFARTGFDVVISRPEGGLKPQWIPMDEVLYFRLLQKMWKATAEGGLILFQVPHNVVDYASAYFQQLISAGIAVTLPQPNGHSYVIIRLNMRASGAFR